MKWHKLICLVTLSALTVVTATSCADISKSTGKSAITTRPEGWTEETHGNRADPNYEVVFPQNRVNQIKITITPEDWSAMQANLTELFGARGSRQPGAPGLRPERGGVAPGDLLPDGGVAPRAPGIPGWVDMTPENPMWIPAIVEFNGLTWTNVGIRYKGNSSLTSGWNSGSLKLPLKFDFDQFEEEHSEINNQRFYGFKQLSLSNAFTDGTYMHDKIAADLLAEAGLPAAKTAYYEVVMDYGEGPVNLGLYVMIEVIDDTVIDRVFGGDSGNIYEADGPAVSLAEGTFNLIKDSFAKENNSQEADWSDIEALYNILHSEQRTSEPAAWRKSLESVFNVDGFLEWLGISAIIQHWDTYGSMTHNFYLYHDPDTGQLNWISWDHNQVLAGDGMGGPGGQAAPIGRMNRSVSLDREEVGQNWPLIRYVLDDPVYHEQYVGYIEATINGVFNPEKLTQKCNELTELLAPYAGQVSTGVPFETAVQQLINRINERYQAATVFLAAEGVK